MSFILARWSGVGPLLLAVMLDAAIKGAVIMAIVAIAIIAMRRSSAASRHLLWFLGTCSLLILPVLSLALPHWDILPDWAVNDRISTVALLPTIEEPVARVAMPVLDQRVLPIYSPALPKIVVPSISASNATPAVIGEQAPFPWSWQAAVSVVWFLGSLLLLGRVGLGFASLAWLRRRCSRVIDDDLLQLIREFSSQLGMVGAIDLLRSPRRNMPMTWGLFRTRILVPVDFQKWSTDQCRAVLLHELAHARRRDCVTQLIAQIARAVYWFNPLVWLACNQMQSERERACDDLVLSSGGRASTYAQQLLQIAAEMPVVRFGTAAIAMARPSTLEGRLTAVLDTKRNRRRVGVRAAIAAAVLVSCCAAILATLRAEEIPPELAAINRWASRYDAKAQLVTATTLEARLGSGWRNIPFSLDANEEADAQECVALAQSRGTTTNGKTAFSKPQTRDELKRILAKRPDYFYAEFLLSIWNRDYGDEHEAERLLEASYQHAPVIVVQRFQFADGSPLAGGAIDSFSLECNRVKNGSLDPSLKLLYINLRTDADGCIYLPVYNTVYRTGEMSFPQGYTAEFAQLGWFETSRKVAVLPPAMVTARAGDFVSATDPNNPPTATAILADDNTVDLLAIGAFSEPAHPWWLPDGSTSPTGYDIGTSGLNPPAAENNRCFVFHFQKSLSDDAHLQVEFSAPPFNVRCYSSVRRQDLGKPFFVFASFPTHPKQINIRMGETAGPWKTLAEYHPAEQKMVGQLPPDYAVKAIDDQNHFAEVIISHPVDGREIRVVAIDTGNHTISANNAWFNSNGKTRDDRYTFGKLGLAAVRHFRIETREYQWAEFKNIAIEPLPNTSALSKPADDEFSIDSMKRWIGQDTQPIRPFITIEPFKTVQRSEILLGAQSPSSDPKGYEGPYSFLKHPADAIVIPPTPGMVITGFVFNVDLDQTVTYTAMFKQAGKPDSTCRVSLANGRDRMEWPNGMMLIHNTLKKQSLFLNPVNKTAAITTMIDVSPEMFQVADIQKMANPGTHPTESLGRKVIDFRDTDGIQWKVGSETRTLWRNPTTHRPVQIDRDFGPSRDMPDPMHITYADIIFGQHLDDKLFTTKAPAGYEQLKAATMKIGMTAPGDPLLIMPPTQPASR